MSERLSTEEREVARQRLADLNVDGWRLESAHDCDGSEEVCAATCPVPVQVQVSPDEIIDAITEPLAAHLADVEARLAAAWDEGANTAWTAAHDVVTCLDGTKDYAPRPTNPYRAALHPLRKRDA